MSPQPDERFDSEEQLVAAVVTGRVSVDHPEVQKLPAVTRERLRRLARLQRELDDASRRERSLLAEVERRAGDAIPPQVEAFLARAGAPGLRGPSIWRRAAGIAAIAAGVVLLAYAAIEGFEDRSGAGSGGGSGTLGSRGAIEYVQPLGGVKEVARFQWRGELPLLGTYELRIWDRDALAADPRAKPAIERSLDEPSWIPDVELPHRFVWRVDIEVPETPNDRGRDAEAWFTD